MLCGCLLLLRHCLFFCFLTLLLCNNFSWNIFHLFFFIVLHTFFLFQLLFFLTLFFLWYFLYFYRFFYPLRLLWNFNRLFFFFGRLFLYFLRLLLFFKFLFSFGRLLNTFFLNNDIWLFYPRIKNLLSLLELLFNIFAARIIHWRWSLRDRQFMNRFFRWFFLYFIIFLNQLFLNFLLVLLFGDRWISCFGLHNCFVLVHFLFGINNFFMLESLSIGGCFFLGTDSNNFSNKRWGLVWFNWSMLRWFLFLLYFIFGFFLFFLPLCQLLYIVDGAGWRIVDLLFLLLLFGLDGFFGLRCFDFLAWWGIFKILTYLWYSVKGALKLFFKILFIFEDLFL